MNISPDGLTVRFETESEELFELEKSGAKSNVLHVMDFDEWRHIKKHNPTKIIIQYQQEFFHRTLTNIHLAGEMLNTWVVIFSWMQERSTDHYHSIKVSTDHELTHTVTFNENTLPGPHSVPFEQGDHSVGLQQEEEPSIDEKFHAITVSTQTLAILQDLAHGQSMDSAIRVLHESYLNRKISTWRPRDE